MFNESQHPRDAEGKFTFKNGGGEKNNTSTNTTIENAANTLYRNEKLQKEIEKQSSKRKNELLDILGDKATNADVMYGTEESLKKKIEKYNLKSFTQDKEKHEILKQLSIYCYDKGNQSIPKGYDRIGHFTGKNNGFDAVVVKNDTKREIVIAYRGMEIPKDVPSALRAGTRNYTSQQKDAQAVYDKIKKDLKYKDYTFYTTGQSLGGYLAQYVAGKNDLKSATFNAFHGTKEALRNEARKDFQTKIIHPDNIVNYRNKEDFLTNRSYHNDIGISLETSAKIKKEANLLEKNHLAENMDNLNNVNVKNKNNNKYIKVEDKFIDPILRGKVENYLHDTLNKLNDFPK